MKYICFLIISLAILFISQGGCTPRKDPLPQVTDTISMPNQEIESSTVFCYEKYHLLWKLESDYAFKASEDTSSMLVTPVRMTFYDTLGDTTYIVLSDSGRITQNQNRFFIWGNVYIETEANLTVKSQSLWWDRTTRKVGSDEMVEIKNPDGNIMRGIGLDATDTFSSWTLRQEVSGEFPEFQDRLKIYDNEPDSTEQQDTLHHDSIP